jgi:uracil-DNA glycosylase family protein
MAAARAAFPGAEEFVPASPDLDVLRGAAPSCRGCDLYEPATQVVFGEGTAGAALMFVGEQPGDVEDQRGEPFVGPAGGVFRRALDEADLGGTASYVTNAVKHFSFSPRGNRRLHQTPRAAHITACRPWLRAETEAVQPALTVCLGATAAKAVLGPDVRVLRDRGAVLDRPTLVGAGPALVTIHPSAVLRAPDEEWQAAYDGLVADLRVVAEFLAT